MKHIQITQYPTMILETWDKSTDCDAKRDSETETYSPGCHKLTSGIEDGYSQISIMYNESESYHSSYLG